MWNFCKDFFLACLITYRISHAIANEQGPFRMFERIRNAPREGTTLHDGLNCQLCLSFWISWLTTWIFPSLRQNYALNALAVGGAVMTVDRAIYVQPDPPTPVVINSRPWMPPAGSSTITWKNGQAWQIYGTNEE